MAVSVRKAIKADIFDVYRLLSTSTLNSRGLPLEARYRMFESAWGGNEDSFGYVMEDGGRVVGFMGTLFTTRLVNDLPQKFCEIHSWYVEEEYRNQSLMVFMPAVSQRNITLLNYTPTSNVYNIGKKFGFQDLEKNLVLFYPIPFPACRIDIIESKELIPDYLETEARRIFYDHRNVECRHLVIMRPGRPTAAPLYVIVKGMRRRWFEPFGRALYVSDAEAFTEVAAILSWKLCTRFGWQCLVAGEDDVTVDRLPRFARRIVRDVPSQFKSKSLTAKDIKPVYTLPLLLGYKLH